MNKVSFAAHDVLVEGNSVNHVAWLQSVAWSTVRRWVRRMEEDPEAWIPYQDEVADIVRAEQSILELLDRSEAFGVLSSKRSQELLGLLYEDPDTVLDELVKLMVLDEYLVAKHTGRSRLAKIQEDDEG